MEYIKNISQKHNMKTSAILTADIHIRSDTPICRTDDYIQSQFDALKFIFELCRKENCPLLIAGDVGNKSQWPNWLLEKFISLVNIHKVKIIAIPGQHDLPEHRSDYWKKSGCGVLHEAGVITLLGNHNPTFQMNDFFINAFGYGDNIHKPSNIFPIQIAMIHQMVIKDKPLWAGQIASKGKELLQKFPEYSLILSGDNHQFFIVKHKGRLLVNPGSMMIMSQDQIDHKPRVYKWFAELNEVEIIYLPMSENIVVQKKDNDMEAFVSHVTNNFEIGLSFEKNMEEYLNTDLTIQKSVKDIIWKVIQL